MIWNTEWLQWKIYLQYYFLRCIALVIDTVLRWEMTLRQGKWKDAICFYLISDSISHSQVPPDGETDVSGMKTPA
jgi:phage-related holin